MLHQPRWERLRQASFFVMSAIIAAGSIAIAARGFGENNWDKIRSATGNGLLLAILLGLFIGIGGRHISDFVVRNVYGATEASTILYTTTYLNMVLMGTAFVFVNFSIAKYFTRHWRHNESFNNIWHYKHT